MIIRLPSTNISVDEIISIIIVPVVSLMTKSPEKQTVDDAFSCLDTKESK